MIQYPINPQKIREQLNLLNVKISNLMENKSYSDGSMKPMLDNVLTELLQKKKSLQAKYYDVLNHAYISK